MTRTKRRFAGEDVTLSGEDFFCLLERGQAVDTPLGPGVIDDISIHAGRYGDRIEMEPPTVTVLLDDQSSNPRRVQVCMCALSLADKEHETIISKEYNRLWPPVDETIPDYAHQLTDMEQVEGTTRGITMQRLPNKIVHNGRTYQLRSARPLRRKAATPYSKDDLVTKLVGDDYSEDEADELADKWAGNAAFADLAELLNENWDQVFEATDEMDAVDEESVALFGMFHQQGMDAMDSGSGAALLASNPDFQDLDEKMQSAVVEIMAKINDVSADLDDGAAFQGFQHGNLLQITSGSAEYAVAEDYEQMEELAEEVVYQDLEEDASMFEQNWLMGHVDEDALRNHLYRDVYDMNYDMITEESTDDAIDRMESMGMDTEAAYDEDGDLDDDKAEDFVSSNADTFAEMATEEQLSDPMSYLSDIYGDKEAFEKIVEWRLIDLESAAKDAVNVDGAAHFLARYDGNYYELDNGAVYWRM